MRTLARRFASRHVGLSSPSAPGHEVRARTTLSTDFHQTSTSDHREKFLVRSQLTVSQGKRERGMLELDPTASSLSSPEPRSSNRASGHPLPHRRRDRTPHLDCTANPRARFLLPHQDPPPRLYGQCQALPSPPGTRLSTSSAQQPRLVALPRRRTTDHPRSDSTAHGIHGFTKRPGSTVSSPPTVIQESSPRERAPLSRDKNYADRHQKHSLPVPPRNHTAGTNVRILDPHIGVRRAVPRRRGRRSRTTRGLSTRSQTNSPTLGPPRPRIASWNARYRHPREESLGPRSALARQ